MKIGSFLASLLAAAGTLSAQIVVPANHAAREGIHASEYPFGLGTQGRVQHLYESSMVATPPAALVRGIAWRGDERAANPGKAGVDLELVLSTSTRDPRLPNTWLPGNHGPAPVTTFQRKLVQLPALPPAFPGPRTFTIGFPFDVPYVYVKAAGTLVVECRVYNQPSAPYLIDANGWERSSEEYRGIDCGRIYVQTSGGSIRGGTSDEIAWDVESAPASGLALLLLGTTVLPSPLPLPVPPCLVYQDAPVILAAAVSATGTARFHLPLPRESFLAVVHSQVVAVDPGITRMPSTATRINTIGGVYPISTVYNTGSVTLPFGSAWYGSAPILELRL